MNIRPVQKMVAVAVAGLLAGSAWAHGGADAAPHAHSMIDSLTSGLTHPLTGADHLAAMVAVGMWSVLSAKRDGQDAQVWRHPLAFVLTLTVGAIMGMAGVNAGAAVEPMIAASLLVLGLLVAGRQQLPTVVGTLLVAGFALFHGLAHGSELTGHAVASLTGMMISTMGLHLAGMAFGQWARDQGHTAKRWVSRIAGWGVAAGGTALLAPAMAQVF